VRESDHAIENSWLISAVPAASKVDALAALSILPKASLEQRHTFSVVVDGERLEIPYRIYNPEADDAQVRTLSPRQQVVVRCLYTRHNDGFVRERNLAQVISESELWVVPYVVQLVGEYVIEILLTIERGLRELNTPRSDQRERYGQFVVENPAYFELIGKRVTSYWNCYYRFQFPRQTDYPGSALVAMLRSAGDDYKTGHQAL